MDNLEIYFDWTINITRDAELILIV
jgi:hypothetical protein